MLKQPPPLFDKVRLTGTWDTIGYSEILLDISENPFYVASTTLQSFHDINCSWAMNNTVLTPTEQTSIWNQSCQKINSNSEGTLMSHWSWCLSLEA